MQPNLSAARALVQPNPSAARAPVHLSWGPSPPPPASHLNGVHSLTLTLFVRMLGWEWISIYEKKPVIKKNTKLFLESEINPQPNIRTKRVRVKECTLSERAQR